MTRDQLLGAITAFLSGHEPAVLAEVREQLIEEIDLAGPEALETLGRRLATAGEDWDYYPPDALARQIHRRLAERFILPASTLTGLEHLDGLAGKPVVILANHLSYSDVNVLEVMLVRHGARAFADRLTAVAGPKVYSSVSRRFSSLCFGTIKVAQSSGVSSEDAAMTPREVARAARRSLQHAHDRVAAGDAVLVFGEGTRSRTRGMQPLLAGVARYLEAPGAWVCPIGLAGTEEFFPISADAVHPVTVRIAIGEPFLASQLIDEMHGDRQKVMDEIGRRIAALLPAEYRGAYASDGDNVCA